MKKVSEQSLKPDRKTIEKNRRNHMKSLYSRLASVIPSQHFKPSKDLSQQDQLHLAASYINQLRERIDELKRIKERAMKSLKPKSSNTMDDETIIGSNLPVVELRDTGSNVEVILITGLQKNFLLYEVISILEEEGAEVVSASFTNIGDKIFHQVHAQVKISRVGVETSRVSQRLHDLVY